MKKFVLIPGLVLQLLVGGCIPSWGGEDEELFKDTEERVEERVIMPNVKWTDE